MNFLHYFSKATRGPSLGTTSWEQAGMCGFGDMAGKCGWGERESAPTVDRAGKCDRKEQESAALRTWRETVGGERGKVRLWTGRQSAALGRLGTWRKSAPGDTAGRCAC